MRLRLSILILSLVLPIWSAEAAITRDDASQAKCSGTTCSVTHVVVAANTMAIVSVHLFGASSVPAVSSFTIGGTPATQIGRVVNTVCAGGQCGVELWGLYNPPTGSQTVSVTLSATSQIILGAVTYLGVDGTTPLGTPVTQTGSSATPSLSLTTESGDMVVGAISLTNAGGSPTPSTGGSAYYSDIDIGGSFHGAGSDMAATGSTTAWGWTYGTAQTFAMLAVPLKAAGSGGGGGGGGGFSTERLLWSDLSSGRHQETSTRVYWRHATQAIYQLIATLAPDSLEYTVSYTTQTDRCYVVDQINSAGTSPLSNELCVTVTAPGPIRDPLALPIFSGGLSDD